MTWQRNQAVMDFLCSAGKLPKCATVTFSIISSPNEEDRSSTLETRKGHVGLLLNENQLVNHAGPTPLPLPRSTFNALMNLLFLCLSHKWKLKPSSRFGLLLCDWTDFSVC